MLPFNCTTLWSKFREHVQLIGGDAENRTPVQRRSYNNVYSLDDINV